MTNPEDGSKWGILGGSFDPVHFGHLNLARDIYQAKNLDGILFIPAVNHPFKLENPEVPFVHRMAMLNIAFEDYPEFAVSSVEADYNLTGYTIETIIQIKKLYPRTTFYFIIGADNIKQFDKWYQPDNILEEVSLLIGGRPNYDLGNIDRMLDRKYEIVETKLFDISSSEIRRIFKNNDDIENLDQLIPTNVRDYILENNLYQ